VFTNGEKLDDYMANMLRRIRHAKEWEYFCESLYLFVFDRTRGEDPQRKRSKTLERLPKGFRRNYVILQIIQSLGHVRHQYDHPDFQESKRDWDFKDICKRYLNKPTCQASEYDQMRTRLLVEFDSYLADLEYEIKENRA
jgi:hypothetical protein